MHAGRGLYRTFSGLSAPASESTTERPDVSLPSALFTVTTDLSIACIYVVGWLVVLRINVDLAIFQPYLDLEAGDNQSLKIQVARPGIEPRSSCSTSQELNHSATTAPCIYVCVLSRSLFTIYRDVIYNEIDLFNFPTVL